MAGQLTFQAQSQSHTQSPADLFCSGSTSFVGQSRQFQFLLFPCLLFVPSNCKLQLSLLDPRSLERCKTKWNDVDKRANETRFWRTLNTSIPRPKSVGSSLTLSVSLSQPRHNNHLLARSLARSLESSQWGSARLSAQNSQPPNRRPSCWQRRAVNCNRFPLFSQCIGPFSRRDLRATDRPTMQRLNG